MRLRLTVLTALYAGLVWLTGCHRLPEGESVAEASEPAFEEGKRLLREGNEQGALAAFSRVIDARHDGAPESHLEVGLLYQLEIKDPIAAIYHFRRYLELKPNSPQADLVRQRIDAATRDFARTLPAQPLENQALRNDYLDVVERLQNENTQLKDKLAAMRANATGTTANTSAARSPANPTTSSSTTSGGFGIVAAPLEENSPRTTTPVAPTRPNPGATTTTAAAGSRTHTVVKGDTLSSLSRRYYNTPTRYRDIYQANRDKMRSVDDLQIGMELVIPQ